MSTAIPVLTAQPIRCYDDLISAIRARVAELNITMMTLDELSGLQPGYSAKLLGPARTKTLGPMSFDALLGALALKLVPQADVEAAQRMETRWEARERPLPARLRSPSIVPSEAEIDALVDARLRERARKAALARWDRLREEQRREATEAARSAKLARIKRGEHNAVV